MKTDKPRVTKQYRVAQNVWDVAAGADHHKRQVKHTAPFPLELVRRHVYSWSNAGDTVFDPFMGSGTTGIVYHELGRYFIGCEIVEDNYNEAVAELNRMQQVIITEGGSNGPQ